MEWRYADVSRIWLALIQGEDNNARLLLERLEEEKNYPQFQMLLDQDVKGLEKYIIKEIRNMRKAFENYLETLAIPEIALLKLAKSRGLELNLPVSEIPAGLLDDAGFDAGRWKLPGQERLDEALGVDGEHLLDRWQLWAQESQEKENR